MVLNIDRLATKLRLVGETPIVCNSFGLISSDNDGYKVYVADKNGKFDNKILSKHYRDFDVLSNFIVTQEDIKYNNKIVTHISVFIKDSSHD